jgi:excisionase family DNA binding protein
MFVEKSVSVEPLLLSIVDAARVLGVGRTKLYELIAVGDVEAVRVGRAVRVPVAALHEFVDQCRTSRVR